MRAALLLTLLLAAPAMAGDLWLELGAGYDEHAAYGRAPQSVIRARYEMAVPWWAPSVLEWDHHSSIPDGSPFNNNREDTADQFSVIWRFQLK